MLTFTHQNRRFNYRVAGLVIQNNRLLIHRGLSDNFWTLPGGRCEWMETASNTLEREFEEELNVKVKTGRLLFISENFFTYGQQQYHEIGLYFVTTLSTPLMYENGQIVTNEKDLIEFKWLHLSDLAKINLKPDFLPLHLSSLPATTMHIVENDLTC